MNRFGFLVILLGITATSIFAQSPLDPLNPVTGEDSLQIPFVDIQIREPSGGEEVALSLQLLLLLAALTLAPSFFILMTSFVRISIVLDFVKRAMSLQQVPPTQILLGIALFMTLFIMWPVVTNVYENAYLPLSEGEIGVAEAFERFERPIRIFMYNQMRTDYSSIELFMRMANLEQPQNLSDVPTYVLIPSFIIHELSVAFKIGILLFIPFIIIDMTIASTLMSMGMIMVPPIIISLPFKLVLFIMVDGWNLLVRQLIASFGGL